MSPRFRKDWHRAFFEMFPSERDSYVAQGEKIISAFAVNVGNRDANSDIQDDVNILKESILSMTKQLKSQSSNIFVMITTKLQDSHRRVTPTVKGLLIPMYEICMSKRGIYPLSQICFRLATNSRQGKGVYARNKEFHQDTMKEKGPVLFEAASKVIRDSIDNALAETSSSFQKSDNAIFLDTTTEIESFLERNSTTKETNTQKSVSPEKLVLQAALTTCLDKMAKAWNSEVPILKEPEIDPKEKAIMDDSHFRDISKDVIDEAPIDDF